MGLPAPSAVLTAVARLVAESRSVRDVVTGLATILRDAIPFEELHVLRFDRAESFELYSADPFGSLNVTARRIAGPGALTDAAVGDARSRLVCTVRQGPQVLPSASPAPRPSFPAPPAPLAVHGAEP